jgi:hypothetical protein
MSTDQLLDGVEACGSGARSTTPRCRRSSRRRPAARVLFTRSTTPSSAPRTIRPPRCSAGFRQRADQAGEIPLRPRDLDPQSSELAESLLGCRRSNSSSGRPHSDDPVWHEWHTRFQAHLSAYGHTVYNLDFMNPVPLIDPAPLLETLRFFVSGKGC